MYNGANYSIKTDNGLTEELTSNTGVLQGCNLSTTLSNIFQNDIHSIFTNDTDPLSLDGKHFFSSISWADDLLLMSKTATGLQKCLDKIEEYCNKWGLCINSDKTKVMVMSLGAYNREETKLHIYGTELKYVTSFKYLGVISTQNGKFKKAMEDRIRKATKCCFSIRNAVSHSENISVPLAITLFDKQVAPVLLYGCSSWALPEVRQIRTLNVQVLD